MLDMQSCPFPVDPVTHAVTVPHVVGVPPGVTYHAPGIVDTWFEVAMRMEKALDYGDFDPGHMKAVNVAAHIASGGKLGCPKPAPKK